MASTSDLIRTAVERFQAEVPALQKLKLVFGLELKGRGDIQLYRVEVPGPKISKDLAQDERVLVQIDRPQFNELAERGTLKSYRKAVETGPHQGERRLQREEADRPGRRAPGAALAAEESPLSVALQGRVDLRAGAIRGAARRVGAPCCPRIAHPFDSHDWYEAWWKAFGATAASWRCAPSGTATSSPA